MYYYPDNYILEYRDKPLPSISYNARKFKESIPTFTAREAPARIIHRQLKREPQTPPKRCLSLPRLKIRPQKHYYKQTDTIRSDLSQLNESIGVEYLWLSSVIELTEDLRKTDSYCSEVHRKAITKRKQVDVLWCCVQNKIDQLYDFQKQMSETFGRHYDPFFDFKAFCAKASSEYIRSLANETRAEEDNN